MPLAAVRRKSDLGTRLVQSVADCGMTDRSAPVSIKKCKLFALSLINKRRLGVSIPLSAAMIVELFSFLIANQRKMKKPVNFAHMVVRT